MIKLRWATAFIHLLLHQAVGGSWSDRTLSTRTIEQADEPCTATNPLTGSYFDLRPLMKGPGQVGGDWMAKGHDYNTNFTISICRPVQSPPSSDFHSIKPYANVSAFYTKDNIQYSLGQSSTRPHFRGRKLVLEYTGGSLCPKLSDSGEAIPGEDNIGGYRKSTLIALVCDRELSKATVTFVGQLNECGYFFEIRTARACPTVKQQDLGPVAIFGIIALVALIVYFVGGCVYQRTVMHARGWRQIPHSQTWASSLFWLKGALAMIASSFGMLIKRLLGGRALNPMGRYSGRSASYSRISRNGGNSQRGGGWSEMDDENRLIDQLDEDWADDA